MTIPPANALRNTMAINNLKVLLLTIQTECGEGEEGELTISQDPSNQSVTIYVGGVAFSSINLFDALELAATSVGTA